MKYNPDKHPYCYSLRGRKASKTHRCNPNGLPACWAKNSIVYMMYTDQHPTASERCSRCFPETKESPKPTQPNSEPYLPEGRFCSKCRASERDVKLTEFRFREDDPNPIRLCESCNDTVANWMVGSSDSSLMNALLRGAL